MYNYHKNVDQGDFGIFHMHVECRDFLNKRLDSWQWEEASPGEVLAELDYDGTPVEESFVAEFILQGLAD